MFNSIIEKTVPVLLMAVVFFLCVIAGSIPASAAAGAASALIGWGLLSATIMAASGACIGYACYDLLGFHNPRRGAIVIGILAGVCTLMLPVITLINGC